MSDTKQKRSFSDIRAVIATVIGLISVYLIICSFFIGSAEEELAKTGGINANLYAGIGLLVIAAGMGLWWLIVPEENGGGSHNYEDAPIDGGSVTDAD